MCLLNSKPVHFIMKIYLYKSLKSSGPRFLTTFFQFLWDFVLLKLKTCSLYHENLFIQKFKVISSQVLNNFFSTSDIMEAVRGRFNFYGMYGSRTLFKILSGPFKNRANRQKQKSNLRYPNHTLYYNN